MHAFLPTRHHVKGAVTVEPGEDVVADPPEKRDVRVDSAFTGAGLETAPVVAVADDDQSSVRDTGEDGGPDVE
jgi:hypothetical protein